MRGQLSRDEEILVGQASRLSFRRRRKRVSIWPLGPKTGETPVPPKERSKGPTIYRRHRGLTLIELLLALAGTGFVGAAIASMLVAVSYGTRADKDMRSLVVRHKTLDARLGAAIRESCMVLHTDDDLLVLWTYDIDGSGTPNLAEIRRIELANEVLAAYRAPDDLDDDDNTEWQLDADFAAVTSAIKGGPTFPGEAWATQVTDYTIALDDADAQAARLVSYRFTRVAGDMQDTAIGAAALRNRN